MKKIFRLFMIFACLSGSGVQAQPREAIKRSTDILMFAPAAAGLATTLVKQDYKGTLQLALGTATSIAVSYGLKYNVKKRRPDGSDLHSFPSNHAGVAFAGATFIQRRYGWKYSVPAYVTAVYVAWGRVYAKRHDMWDVLAGAAIGVGSSYIFTRPFAKKHQLNVTPVAFNGKQFGLHASMTF